MNSAMNSINDSELLSKVGKPLIGVWKCDLKFEKYEKVDENIDKMENIDRK